MHLKNFSPKTAFDLSPNGDIMENAKINYQIILDKTLTEIESSGARSRLLLHACCAPCSSYVIEYLSSYFDITLLYYNPNIQPETEYSTRAEELRRLARDIDVENRPYVTVLPYTPEDFENISRGLEHLSEGGERCKKCYALRLEKTAALAKEGGFDYFTTTLSISPHKNASVLCKIGGEIAEKYGVAYLFSDFKKKNGYLRSCELSERYSLYRQDYCGCLFSLKRKQEK